jgi:hypothetical protein
VRRLLTFVPLVAVLSAALVGLPTLTTATAQPRPVPASIQRIPLAAADTVSSRTLRSGSALLSGQRSTQPFSLMGVTWRPDPALGDVEVLLRHRSAGRWSDWEQVEADVDDAPDTGSADTRGPSFRVGTAPIWTGPSDGVQVRVVALSGARPRDVAIELVDPGTSPADARPDSPRDTAHAEEPQPEIITRAQWGADESIRRGNPSYNSTVKVGFVHHTASSNDYTAEQAAAMVRGIYAYHVKSNGWSDIGYNYLVDRFGRVYEGRAGGLDKFVVGAHTGGFNKDSFGVSLLGDFSTVPATEETLGTLSRVLAWKLGSAHREPLGKAVLTSAGGGTSRHPSGSAVTFDVISGHRDAGSTACPGATTYARMGDIRLQAAAALGAGLVDPVVTGGRAHARGSRGPVTASARTRTPLEWTTKVEDSAGTVLRTASGVATIDEPVSLTWDLTDDRGRPVPAGVYLLRLSGTFESDSALPYVVRVVVKAEQCRGAPLARARCTTTRRG